jgi:hypothetical protein
MRFLAVCVRLCMRAFACGCACVPACLKYTCAHTCVEWARNPMVAAFINTLQHSTASQHGSACRAASKTRWLPHLPRRRPSMSASGASRLPAERLPPLKAPATCASRDTSMTSSARSRKTAPCTRCHCRCTSRRCVRVRACVCASACVCGRACLCPRRRSLVRGYRCTAPRAYRRGRRSAYQRSRAHAIGARAVGFRLPLGRRAQSA